MSLRKLTQAAPAVPYGWQRPAFRSGDIFAQSHGGWGTWKDFKVMCVRVCTLSTYSHVGVIEVDPTDGRVYAIEAVQPCVHRVPLSTIGSFYHLPMRRAQWDRGTAMYVDEVLGTPYSQLDAIRAFFNPLPAGTATECAALTREIEMRCGVDLGPMSRPDAVVQRALELGSSITYIQNNTSKTTESPWQQ
jgi:hypothetical protein